MPEPSTRKRVSGETALVLFCDLQKGIVKHSKTNSPQALASAASALLKLAKLFGLPTIVSVVPEGKDPPEIIPELNDATGFAPQILRSTASLFDDAATEVAISRSDRNVLIVAGLLMEAVVLRTVLDARAEGYEVLIPVDACGSSSMRTEQAVLRQMEAAGAISTSIVSLGVELSPNFSTFLGKQMFEIVQGIKVD